MFALLVITLFAYALLAAGVTYLLHLPDPHVPRKDGPLMEDDELSYLAGGTLLFICCLVWIITRAM